MTIAVFVSFILYTIACVMDGPDVKPKWKHYLGAKLEHFADGLKPIDYCVHTKCKYFGMYCENPPSSYKKIEEIVEVNEYDLFEARRNEEICRLHPIPFPPSKTVNWIMEDARERAKRSVLMCIEQNFLTTKIIKEEDCGKVLVGCSVYVKKTR